MSSFDHGRSPLPFCPFCQHYLRQKIFWKALLVSLPSGALTYFWMSQVNSEIVQRLTIHGAAFSCLALLISVFVAFRASQAYARFWDGTCSLFRIRGHFFDVVSSLFAFTRRSTANQEDVQEFRHAVIRLFSMLETFCLADLCAEGRIDGSEAAFSYAIIDPSYFNEETITAIGQADFPIDLIVQWLQSIIVDGMASNIIAVPPPICTRVFHELQSGLSAFHCALRITEVPIPFPYTAATHLVFVLFWLMMPLAAGSWSDSAELCGVLATIQVLALYVLNAVAGEMENPFGSDVNDLDVEHGHLEFNHRLWTLLSPTMNMLPVIATHHDTATKHCPHAILKRQTTMGNLFDVQSMSKVQGLFKHSKESTERSGALSVKLSPQRDNVLPTRETSNFKLKDLRDSTVSLDAIDTTGTGIDMLISDKCKPLTQVLTNPISGPMPVQTQRCHPLHAGDDSPGKGIHCNGQTKGSSDAIVEDQCRVLHEREAPTSMHIGAHGSSEELTTLNSDESTFPDPSTASTRFLLESSQSSWRSLPRPGTFASASKVFNTSAT